MPEFCLILRRSPVCLLTAKRMNRLFFYMTQDDKDYAVEYYFEHLLKEKDIDYNAYRRTLDYFLLYEYCEWIMLGIEYNDTGNERFPKYYAKAKEHVKKLI